jgi:hypothetical protein
LTISESGTTVNLVDHLPVVAASGQMLMATNSSDGRAPRPRRGARAESLHSHTSAAALQPWWANESDGHIHARAWLSIGRKTGNVELNAETVDLGW